MKNWQNLVWRVFIAVLVIFFGGWVLGSILNFAALANPQEVSSIFCPAGSTAVKASANDASSNGSAISCHDPKNGTSVPSLTEDESIVLQRKYFYRPSYLTMIILVVGWFIWSSSQKIMRKQEAAVNR